MDLLPHEKKIEEYLKTIENFKKQSQDTPLFQAEIVRLEQKLEKLKQKVYSELTPWQRIQICRHPARPHALDYAKKMCDSFFELYGDRTYSDDQAIIGGLATIGSMRCILIGQERGHDTESRVKRNFGMPHPEGYRKALRLMQLAEKFELPIVSLLDTPGAFPGLEAEERGQGWAIAYNLREMARLSTPIIVVIIGEGYSGGALGIGLGDTVGMLQHACYSVISPEGCASILWKDPSKNVEAASALKMHAEDLLRFEVVDEIIPEPQGGAHHDPERVYNLTKRFILTQWGHLQQLSKETLLEQRYLKFRKIGAFTYASEQNSLGSEPIST